MALLEEPIKEVKTIKNFINGEWVESKGEIVETANPATGQVIARVPISTKDEIDAADGLASLADTEGTLSLEDYLESRKER